MTNFLEQRNKRAWNWLESTAGRVVLVIPFVLAAFLFLPPQYGS